jgi:hypothetical protein
VSSLNCKQFSSISPNEHSSTFVALQAVLLHLSLISGNCRHENKFFNVVIFGCLHKKEVMMR